MKTIGLLGLSNPCSRQKIQPLYQWLKSLGMVVLVSPYLYTESTPEQRASVFNTWIYENIDYIFDVSGGDLANETIPYLDLDAYRRSTSFFYGYSDLTCVLNVLAPLRRCALFQICGNTHTDLIEAHLKGISDSLFIGSGLGGNIRCLLKLAGTPYFPDLKGKRLYLESYSGDEYRIRTFFAQLKSMGVLDGVKSICLGQFTELDTKDRKVLDRLCQGIIYQHDLRFSHSADSYGVWLED